MNERVKKLRKAVGLTQEEFATKIQLGGSTVSKIEKGDIALTDRNINAICDAFSVSEEWLRTGKGEMMKQHSDDANLAYQLGQIMSGKFPYQKKLIESILCMSDEEACKLTELLKKLV